MSVTPDAGARAAADQALAAQDEMAALWTWNELPEHIDPRVVERLRRQGDGNGDRTRGQLITDGPRGGREAAGDRYLWWAGRCIRLAIATPAELVRLTHTTAPDPRNFPCVGCDQCGELGVTACLVTAHGRDLVGLALCEDCHAVWNREPGDRRSRRYAAGPWKRPKRNPFNKRRTHPEEDW